MQASHRYSHSPLTEALIDLRCELPESTTLRALARVHAGEENRYPVRQNHMQVPGKLTFGAQVSASTSQKAVGYIFWDSEKRQAFQARLDGYTFSRLAPYDRWETFRDEARRLWDRYRSVAEPRRVTRIAVRYINKLGLPLPLRDFKDYLQTVPEVSPELPQGLSGFLMRLQIPQGDIEAQLILNEALVPPEAEDVVSVVLDIDLFREVEAPMSESELWDYLEVLRVRKNQVFEACITDRTREVIG